MSEDYSELKLPEWDKLYTLPEDGDMETYLHKGFEALKLRWEARRKEKASGDDPKPSKSSKKPSAKAKPKRAAVEESDDDEIPEDWE